jgi:hypothetical protein
MANLANITISNDDYKSLLINGAFTDIKIISVKILPDDSDLKENELYKELQKKYSKARKELEDFRFQQTTNK